MLSGKQLKILRIKKDIEAQEIAKKLNLSKSYISIMEREKQTIPQSVYTRWILILEGEVE
ncbi:helix-turn-helix domain-containing protein [Paenibacillus sp. GCM10027627]|uniref:helix-turn-helix domain-containing protein n=1 Tax=unclassified Paenibacillus TaxID=185978 RepID=UPI0036354D1A